MEFSSKHAINEYRRRFDVQTVKTAIQRVLHYLSWLKVPLATIALIVVAVIVGDPHLNLTLSRISHGRLIQPLTQLLWDEVSAVLLILLGLPFVFSDKSGTGKLLFVCGLVLGFVKFLGWLVCVV